MPTSGPPGRRTPGPTDGVAASDSRQNRDPAGYPCNDVGMKRFLMRVGINAVALWVATLVVSGVNLAEGDQQWTAKVVTIVLVALVFGLVNAVIRPIVKFLAFPAMVLTLGLFTFIVNAFMLQITEWISGPLGLSFSIHSFFWDAVFAAVVITVVSWLLSVILPEDD